MTSAEVCRRAHPACPWRSFLSPRIFDLASRLHGRGVLLATALVFCFALAYGASAIGLAPIVGAYAAGLILEDVHFRGSLSPRSSASRRAPLGAFGASLDRVSIGLGVIPRGEVGLIFANIGLGLTIAGQPVVDNGIFSAVVIIVILTTMATPPALKWSFARNQRTDAKT
jgi:Kef-type K+ transport system membrane component KefB